VKRSFFAIAFTLLYILLFSFSAFTSDDVIISGKVFSENPEIVKSIMLVKVVARKGNRVLAVGHELLDTTGVYKLSIKKGVAPSQQTPIDIYIAGLGIDTMYIKSYYSFSGNNIALNIEVPNTYTKDGNGTIICPKCGGSANVLPVKYGSHKHVKRVIHNGDTTYVAIEHNIPSEIYSELHPYWYCNICRIQF